VDVQGDVICCSGRYACGSSGGVQDIRAEGRCHAQLTRTMYVQNRKIKLAEGMGRGAHQRDNLYSRRLVAKKKQKDSDTAKTLILYYRHELLPVRDLSKHKQVRSIH